MFAIKLLFSFVSGLAASTALYGALSLLLIVVAFDRSISSIYESAQGAASVEEVFQASLLFMAVIYPPWVVLRVVVSRRRSRREVRSLVQVSGWVSEEAAAYVKGERASWYEFIWWNITNPFRGLRDVWRASSVIDSRGFWKAFAWGEVWLHFVWAVCLFLYFGLGCLIVVT